MRISHLDRPHSSAGTARRSAAAPMGVFRFDRLKAEAGQPHPARGVCREHVLPISIEDLSAHRPGAGRHPLPTPETSLPGWPRTAWTTARFITYDARSSSAVAAGCGRFYRWFRHQAVAILDGGSGVDRVRRDAPAVRPPRTPPAARGVSPAGPRRRRVAPGFPAGRVEHRRTVAGLRSPRACSWMRAHPERYAGTVEPIDSVAGRVPGASIIR